MQPWAVVLIVVAVLVIVMLFLMVATRYKKCPPNKIMIKYGKVGRDKDGNLRSAKCIHGGASFIVPLFQSFTFLDLTPLSIAVDLKSALSRQNIRIDVPSIFTVGISTEPTVMENAAERLHNLKMNEIQELAKDIIFGQLRLVIATMNIEEINTDRDKFLEAISRNVEGELKKIGLRLINVNVTDISDESGYIIALGKEAAAKAINDATSSAAEANKIGSIGEANAKMEERIRVAQADSEAIKGENLAKAEIAKAQAELREKEAEALKLAVTAEKVQAAKALEESYIAEKEAEVSRASREKATQEADVIVKSEIEKRRKEIEADAEAEQIRRKARGEADAIFAKMEAEARGLREKLSKQAEGMQALVQAAGGAAEDAVRLIVADKIEQLVAEQVEAIKNIKIDKVTVWDGGSDKDGKNATAGFLSGLLKSLPPLEEMYNMAGLSLPKLVAPQKEEDVSAKKAPEPPAAKEPKKDAPKPEKK